MQLQHRGAEQRRAPCAARRAPRRVAPLAAAAEHLARRRGAGDAVHKGAEAALGTARQLQHTHAAPPLDDGFHQRPWHVGGRALEEVRVGWRRAQRRQRGHGASAGGSGTRCRGMRMAAHAASATPAAPVAAVVAAPGGPVGVHSVATGLQEASSCAAAVASAAS